MIGGDQLLSLFTDDLNLDFLEHMENNLILFLKEK